MRALVAPVVGLLVGGLVFYMLGFTPIGTFCALLAFIGASSLTHALVHDNGVEP